MKKLLLMLFLGFFAFACSKDNNSSKDIDIDRAITLAKSYIDNADLAMAYLRKIQPGTQMCTEASGSLVSPDFEAWAILTLPASQQGSYSEVWTVVFINADDGSIVAKTGVPDRDPYRDANYTRLIKIVQK